MVTFLKSRSNVIRETARDTLIQMMVSLGPQYLSALMDAASPILQRGFQVHVYIYTMHAILVKMGETGHLKPACLDDVVSPLVEVSDLLLIIDKLGPFFLTFYVIAHTNEHFVRSAMQKGALWRYGG